MGLLGCARSEPLAPGLLQLRGEASRQRQRPTMVHFCTKPRTRRDLRKPQEHFRQFGHLGWNGKAKARESATFPSGENRASATSRLRTATFSPVPVSNHLAGRQSNMGGKTLQNL